MHWDLRKCKTARRSSHSLARRFSVLAADVEILEERCLLSPIPGADQVVLPGEGFNSIQFSPSGQLTDLVWLHQSNQLIYRVRDASGNYSQELVYERDFGAFDRVRDTEAAQLLYTSDGIPHVLLVEEAHRGAIQHFARIGGVWQNVESINIPPVGSSFRFVARAAFRAAVGPDDSFHIIAYGSTTSPDHNPHYFYGTDKTGLWMFETVTGAGDPFGYFQQAYAPRFLSLAVDSQNAAHFLYVPEFSNIPNLDGTTRVFSQLNYASNRGGSWFKLAVDVPPDGTGDAGLGASLAIGPGDQVAIANFFVERVDSGSPVNAHLAYHELLPNNTFSRTIVANLPDGYVAGDGPNYTGFVPQLVFDPVGRPNIIFSDYASQHFEFLGADEFGGQIRRAVRTWGQWRLETIFQQTNPLENQIVFPTVAISPTEFAYTASRRRDTLLPDLTIEKVEYFHLTLSRPFDMNPSQLIVTGADAGGGPHVRMMNATTGQTVVDLFPYGVIFRGGVRIAMGDVNNDNFPDVITAPGPTGGPHVRVFDGRNGSVLSDQFAYNSQFTGGVFVASADINGDQFAEIITGPDAGGGPHVRVMDGRSGQALRDFFAYAPHFSGGVRVATGDINGDTVPDIVTAPGPTGGPHIRVFDGKTGALIREFFAYAPNFTGGVYVAAADFNGDNRAEIITGAGAGGGPHVRVFDGATGNPIRDLFPYSVHFAGGVRVATGDTNGDGLLDFITAPGPGGGPHVRAFDGATGTPFADFFAYSPAFSGGVLIGGWAPQTNPSASFLPTDLALATWGLSAIENPQQETPDDLERPWASPATRRQNPQSSLHDPKREEATREDPSSPANRARETPLWDTLFTEEALFDDLLTNEIR